MKSAGTNPGGSGGIPGKDVAKVIPLEELQPLIQEADEIRRVIGAIIVSGNAVVLTDGF